MPDRERTRKLALDAAIVLAGIVYVIAALVFQLSSPVLGAAIVIVAGVELLQPRKGPNRSRGDHPARRRTGSGCVRRGLTFLSAKSNSPDHQG
jgi:hypothetical protein